MSTGVPRLRDAVEISATTQMQVHAHELLGYSADKVPRNVTANSEYLERIPPLYSIRAVDQDEAENLAEDDR